MLLNGVRSNAGIVPTVDRVYGAACVPGELTVRSPPISSRRLSRLKRELDDDMDTLSAIVMTARAYDLGESPSLPLGHCRLTLSRMAPREHNNTEARQPFIPPNSARSLVSTNAECEVCVHMCVCVCVLAGVPHRWSTTIMHVLPPSANAHTIQFIVNGSRPDPQLTLAILRAVTGGDVRINSIRPYDLRRLELSELYERQQQLPERWVARLLWLRLACSPPAKAILVQSPTGSLPDVRMWDSCWTMPLVGFFFSGISLFPRPFIPAPLHTHLDVNPFVLPIAKHDLAPFGILASHQGEPSSILGRVPRFSQMTMPLFGRFSRGSPVFPTPSFRHSSIFILIALIVSQDLAVKRRLNLFTHLRSQLSASIVEATVLYDGKATVDISELQRLLQNNVTATHIMEPGGNVGEQRIGRAPTNARCWREGNHVTLLALYIPN
ncbi:hypothetical protein PR048_030461 [Dryococelus australis]|uniref:Uncharacterized protein n=1 Tax=Dryococelus australis TaxID=614101 RepID=A0ABQ9G922_9NEOP|nr:hypothetical protein PR048_030461 [Dryococelus australis]